MMTCTFLCDDPIIDTYFYTCLQYAVQDVVTSHEAVEFLMPYLNTQCAIYCLYAILEAKQRYPSKHIVITKVAYLSDVEPEEGCSAQWYIPSCFYDRCIVPFITPRTNDDNNFIQANNKLVKWAIDQADCVIMYHYVDLNTNTKLYQYVCRNKMNRIDLTQQDTIRFIRSCIPDLTPDQQWLKTQREQGVPFSKLAKKYNRSIETIRHRCNKIAFALSRRARRRFLDQNPVSKTSSPIICSVLLDSKPLSENMQKNLKQSVSFLIERFENTVFIVEPGMCNAETVQILKQLQNYILYITRIRRSQIKEIVESGQWPQVLGVSDFVIYSGKDGQDWLTELKAANSDDEDTVPLLKALDISKELELMTLDIV